MPATLVVLPETTCSSRSILVVLMALVVLLVAPVVLVVLALVLVPTTSAPRPLQVPPILEGSYTWMRTLLITIYYT